MVQSDLLSEAGSIADLLEQAADQFKPDVIRAARVDEGGRRDLDRIEYALGTIGKAMGAGVPERVQNAQLEASLLRQRPLAVSRGGASGGTVSRTQL